MLQLMMAIIFLTILPGVGFGIMAYKMYDNYEYDKSLLWLLTGVSVGFFIDAIIMFLVYKPFV